MSKHRHSPLPVKVAGFLVGMLIGAGIMQSVNLVAYSLEHRDTVYRNSRSISEAKEQGWEDPGNTGTRQEWHDQRTENASHGVAPNALPMYCPGQSALRRSRCLLNELNAVVEELESADTQE